MDIVTAEQSLLVNSEVLITKLYYETMDLCGGQEYSRSLLRNFYETNVQSETLNEIFPRFFHLRGIEEKRKKEKVSRRSIEASKLMVILLIYYCFSSDQRKRRYFIALISPAHQ